MRTVLSVLLIVGALALPAHAEASTQSNAVDPAAKEALFAAVWREGYRPPRTDVLAERRSQWKSPDAGPMLRIGGKASDAPFDLRRPRNFERDGDAWITFTTPLR